jgi:hypothetical protein
VTQALGELEAALAGGFRRWEHFRRARRTGLFPAPARELPGQGPVWTQAQIDQWLGIVEPAPDKTGNAEDEALRRVREKAALR